MFGLFMYTFGAFFLALVIVGLSRLFIKIGSIGDKPMASRLLIAGFACFSFPYLWVEFNTIRYGEGFSEYVESLEEDGLIRGELLYYKVQYAFATKSRILLVSETVHDWGGTSRNLYAIKFEKHDDEEWHPIEINKVNTEDGDSAGFTIPPYW